MPADLPPDSAYTYAFDINADEAQAVGALRVQLSQPATYYVDNFLGLPVGALVPVGSYQRTAPASCATGGCGAWVPEENGRIMKVLSISGQLADLDLNGDNVADGPSALAALGITDAERGWIAQLYPPGKSIWRTRMTHFTPYDHNWGVAPPPDAIACDVTTMFASDVTVSCRPGADGAQISATKQTVHDEEPITATPYKLVYQSDRVEGNASTITS